MTSIMLFITLTVAVLILIAETAISAARGWKMSLIRLGENLVAALLAFLLAKPVSGGLLALLRALAGQNAGIEETVYSALTENRIGLSTSEEIAKLCDDIALGIAAAVAFVVLLWVLIILFAILNKIVFSLLSKNKEKQPLKTSAHLIGLAVGIVSGLLFGALTLMPISGLSKTAEPLSGAAFLEGQPTASEGIEALIAVPTDDIYRFVGVGYLSEAVWHGLSDVKSGKCADALSEAVSLAAENDESLAKLIELTGSGDEQIPETLEVAAKLFESVNASDLFTEECKLSIINSSLAVVNTRLGTDLFYTNTADTTADLTALAELIEKLSEKNLLTLFTNENPTIADINIAALDKETIVFCADRLYSLSFRDTLVPMIADKAVGAIAAEARVNKPALPEIPNLSAVREDFTELLTALSTLSEKLGERYSSVEALQEFLVEVEPLKDNAFISPDLINALIAHD